MTTSENKVIIISRDTEADLIRQYNLVRLKYTGKTISDIAFVVSQLTDWIPISRADLIIPYTHAKKNKEPKGNRIWYLSHEQKSSYYNGCFFDIIATKAKGRILRKMCRLGIEALLFYRKYSHIVAQNKEIIVE